MVGPQVSRREHVSRHLGAGVLLLVHHLLRPDEGRSCLTSGVGASRRSALLVLLRILPVQTLHREQSIRLKQLVVHHLHLLAQALGLLIEGVRREWCLAASPTHSRQPQLRVAGQSSWAWPPIPLLIGLLFIELHIYNLNI